MYALTRVVDRVLRRTENLDARLTALVDNLSRSLTPPGVPRPDPGAREAGSDGHDADSGPAEPGVRSWLLADDPARAGARMSVVATIGYLAFIAGPPTRWLKISDIATASVGAPPVRETTDSSPTAWAVDSSMAGSTSTPVRPSEFTNAAAPSTVPCVTAAEEFMAK